MKVCAHCFNNSDEGLQQFILLNSNEKEKCVYCSDYKQSELIPIEELLDFFSEIINLFKADEQGSPLNQLIQKDWELFSEKADYNSILSEVLTLLKSSFSYQDKVSYIDEIKDYISYWEYLKEDIKWVKRFLINTQTLDDLGWVNLFNQSTTKWINGDPLYRARLHYIGNQKEFNIADMGCPDKYIVPAGRANPLGIPYLYLSKNIETVLYEVRSSFLDEVSIGTFQVKKGSSLVLVDFNEKVNAFSNVDEIVEYAKSMLLKRLISNDLSKPIRRYDSEIEYIPTQFICEYINYISNADGIIFNSSLHPGGKNIVLFKQDKVECVKVELYRVSQVDIVGERISSM